MTAKPGLGTRLRTLIAMLDGDLQALYDEAGLPFRPRFFPFVQHLLAEGPASVTALARASGVSQPAATQTLAEMTRAGLVEVANGQDRRERLIALSPRGAQLAAQLRPIWTAAAAAAAELDRELPQPLFETLDQALAALEQQPFGERVRRRLKNA